MKLDTPVRQLGPCPVDAVLAALPAADDPVWDTFAARQNRYDAHGATRSIAFVWTDLMLAGEPVVLAPDYAPAGLSQAVQDCADWIASQFPGGRIVRLMLAELKPGGAIKRHRDSGPLLEAVHRCHVAVETNPAVDFLIDDLRHPFDVGEGIEVDNTRPHAVSNGGATRRVHLICDILPAASMA